VTQRLLVDTHDLLWWLAGDRKLKAPVRAVLADPENLVFVSAASIWELRIKEALGKVELPDEFEETLDAQSFEHLSVTAAHAHALKGLALHHRDPFDRMLVAQASLEGLTIVSHDDALRAYGVPLILT
jgi:PIN domain nuclease of toxin-antitoxin system